MTGSVEIVEAIAVDDELVEAFVRLTPQLSRSNPAPDAEALAGIVDSPATVMFLARDGEVGAGGTIIGSLTLAVFPIPTGRRAWIEDVVVDEAARGKGIGRKLNEAAIARAEAMGCRTVDLTSRPSREAANRLYRNIGFVQRETNVYRYQL